MRIVRDLFRTNTEDELMGAQVIYKGEVEVITETDPYDNLQLNLSESGWIFHDEQIHLIEYWKIPKDDYTKEETEDGSIIFRKKA